MYINETYTSLVGGDCKTCENRSICKWTSEKVRIDKELANIEKNPLSPITLSSDCKNYKKEGQKQDGFHLLR